uniref:Uncharacterized protein n=1 Tax=Oryza punctata TaxID=4537 RepID=A0A0E0JNK7_ORYPU
MEGEEEFFAGIDSLWFFSNVFLLLPPPVKEKTNCPPPGPGELQIGGERDFSHSTEIHETDGDCGHRDPGGVREAAAPVAGGRRAAAAAAARGWVVEEERMDMWQCRQMRVAAAAPARCSPLPMPRTRDGSAMRAHLRSWAHAVACSVR